MSFAKRNRVPVHTSTTLNTNINIYVNQPIPSVSSKRQIDKNNNSVQCKVQMKNVIQLITNVF